MNKFEPLSLPYLILSLLFFLNVESSFANPSVKIKISKRDIPLSSNGSPIIQVDTLDPKINAGLNETMEKIKGIVERLIIPEDKFKNLNIMLLDDMTPNAMFHGVGQETATIFINVGLLDFVKSDDELAFILGHELEHGHSELTEMHRLGYNRTGEVEIDIRSIRRRVLPNNYNPQAAMEFFYRLRSQNLDGFSATHAASASRLDAMATNLESMSRLEGIDTRIRTGLQTQILDPVKRDYFDSKEWILLAKKRWQEYFQGQIKFIKESTSDKGSGLQWSRIPLPNEGRGLALFGDLTNDLKLMAELQSESYEETVKLYLQLEKEKAFVARNFKNIDDLNRAMNVFGNPRGGLQDFSIEGLSYLLKIRSIFERGEKEKYRIKETKEAIELRIKGIQSIMPESNWSRIVNLANQYSQLGLGSRAEVVDALKMSEPLKEEYKRLLSPKHRKLLQTVESNKMEIEVAARSLYFEIAQDYRRWEEFEKMHTFFNNNRLSKPTYELLVTSMMKAMERSPNPQEVWSHHEFSLYRDRIYDNHSHENIELIKKLIQLEMSQPDIEINLIPSPYGDSQYNISIGESRFKNDLLIKLGESDPLVIQKIFEKLQNSFITQTRQIDKFSSLHLKSILDQMRSWHQHPIFINHIKAQGLDLKKTISSSHKSIVDLFTTKLQSYFKTNLSIELKTTTAKGLLALVSPELEELIGEIDYINTWKEFEKLMLLQDSEAFKKIFDEFNFHHWFSKVGKSLNPEEVGEIIFKYRHFFSFLKSNNPLTPHTESQLFLRSYIDSTFNNNAPLEDFLKRFQFAKSLKQAIGLTYDDQILKLDDLAKEVAKRVDIDFPGLSPFQRSKKIYQGIKFANGSTYKVLVGPFLPTHWDELLQYHLDLIRDPQLVSLQYQNDESVSFIFDKSFDSINAKSPSFITQIFNDPTLRKKIDLDTLTEFMKFHFKFTKASPELDQLFELWWMATEMRPDLRNHLETDIVNKIYYDANKEKLARWQIEARLHLSQEAKKIKLVPPKERPSKGVRPVIENAVEIIKVQFPEPSVVREAIVSDIEEMLITNQKESSMLHALRLGADNWTSASTAIKGFDLPHMMVSNLNPEKRLALLKYLTGLTEENPAQILLSGSRFNTLNNLSSLEEKLLLARSRYHDSGELVRTHFLLSLLDPQKGILSTPSTRTELLNLLIGDRTENKIVSALINAYLKSIPESQQSVLIGRITAMRSTAGLKGEISLAKILEMMGPLGIKAGQFLSSSGIGGKKVQKELIGLLNKASPPNRNEIFEKIEKLLGPKYSQIKYIDEVVGSGSVNYVVKAVIETPIGPREVVIRILRDAVEGKVVIEDKIWQDTIRNLRASNDSELESAAEIMNEARTVAMRTLGPNGQELDMSIDSYWFKRLKNSYSTPSSVLSYGIELARPLDELMQGLSEETRKSIAIYDYVKGVPLWEIKNKNLRAKLGLQILSTELDAIFLHGTFDPDSHLGNWIIDETNKKLVRIDYSQALNISDKNILISSKTAIGTLLSSDWNSNALASLESSLRHLIQFDQNKLTKEQLLKLLAEISVNPEFPSQLNPQGRLLFIREMIEKQTGKEARILSETQSIFASLGRLLAIKEHVGDTVFFAALAKKLSISPLVLANEAIKALKESEPFIEAEKQLSEISTSMMNKGRSWCHLVNRIFSKKEN